MTNKTPDFASIFLLGTLTVVGTVSTYGVLDGVAKLGASETITASNEVVVPLAPVPTATAVIPPEAVLPQETVPAIAETSPPPAVVLHKKHRRHRRQHVNHDPMLIVSEETPVSHNEEETMNPTRAYCARLGNPKALSSDRPKVCFERDMITGKIYTIPN